MGAEVILVGLAAPLPSAEAAWGATVFTDLDSLIGDVDICYLLRVQKERQSEQFFPTDREYAALWD